MLMTTNTFYRDMTRTPHYIGLTSVIRLASFACLRPACANMRSAKNYVSWLQALVAILDSPLAKAGKLKVTDAMRF